MYDFLLGFVSHSVSGPDASWLPTAFVVPGGQDVQTWEDTYSSTEHKVGSHAVSDFDASSPAAFVLPGGHDVQILDETYSLTEHIVGSQYVLLLWRREAKGSAVSRSSSKHHRGALSPSSSSALSLRLSRAGPRMNLPFFLWGKMEPIFRGKLKCVE